MALIFRGLGQRSARKKPYTERIELVTHHEKSYKMRANLCVELVDCFPCRLGKI